MKNNHYVAGKDTLAFIKAYGRCAITRQAFAATADVSAVLLPAKAAWPLPVWDDFPLGTNAKAVAFIIRPPAGTSPPLLATIAEATECNGRSITFHPVTLTKEEANETATLQEV